MTNKNNLIFYESGHYTREAYGHVEEYHPAVFVVAGGRARVPVMLLWLTWSLILAVLFVIDTWTGIASGDIATEFVWNLSLYWVLGLVAVFVIYWPLKFVWYVLSWWVEIFRKAM
jgi:hypothetical protein